jgi:ribA/ribD-fused uncharacterized protein
MSEFTFFWDGPFSQWYPSFFKVDGIEYCCCEQYMMAKKALFFGDNDTHKKIMGTTSPKEQKKLGREVKNFNEGQWNKVAKDIVEEGNYAKFSQNKSLKDILLATKGTSLVEASPYDTIWGIGLREGDPLTLNRETWRGTNWLGEVLDKVRDRLINE